MAEATMKDLVQEYNRAVDAAIEALAAVAKESQGARLTFRPAGRPDGTGKPTFTGSRTTVTVRPGAVPLVGSGRSFFHKLANDTGDVE